MKKLLAVALIIILLVSLFSFTGCNDTTAVTIYVPDGAPALSVASLMNLDTTIDGRPISVHIEANGAGVVGALTGGQADIAILPISKCVSLYNQGLDIRLLSVQTWGNLYLVGQNHVDIQELKGKIVCCIGQNDVPGIMFRNILSYNAIEYVENSETPTEDKVTINYYSDASHFIPLLKQKKVEFGVLGEPAASKVIGAPCVQVLDFQSEWQKISGLTNKGFPQAGMVIKGELAKDEAFVNALLTALKQNDTYITTNPEDATTLLKNNGSTVAGSTNFTAEIISRCGINSRQAKTVIHDLSAIYPVYKLTTPSVEFYL